MTDDETLANRPPELPDPTGLAGLVARVVIALGNVHRRLLAAYFAIIGPEAAYWIAALLARCLYRLLDPIRLLSEGQCRAALAGHVPDGDVPHIAEQAFVHRVWNLADLMLAERLLHPNTQHLYCEPIPEPDLDRILDAQRRGQPAIMLTGYYGSFDLLPLFLGFNGIRAGVVYRHHANVGFDAYRRQIRERGGCELIPVERAANRLAAILESGGTVAIVADHHADRRGMPVSFMGIPTMAMRTVGLLACQYDVDIVVAGIRRLDNAFRFRLIVLDVIYHAEWQRAEDPVAYITGRYLRGLEALILGDPTQYMWGYARWGKEYAFRLMSDRLDAPGAVDPTRR
jgi:lauroyl/myristoyl acyltransferase